MHKQKFAAIALTLLTLSACGKSSNNDPAPGPQPFPSPSPSPEPTPGPTPTALPDDLRIPEVKSIERDWEAAALLVTFNIPIKPNGTVRLTINEAAVKHQSSWSEDKTQLRIVFDRKPYSTTPFKLTLNLEGVNGKYANFTKTLSFVEDKEVPALVSATQVGLESLTIVFSEPLSEKTRYFLVPTDISTGPVFSDDRTTLTLPFDHKKAHRYSRFEITSAVDMAGNVAPQPFVFRFDLEGPALEGIVWQDGDILQVKFNEPAILENSVVTIDGKTIENLGVDRSKPQQILNIPLGAYSIDKTASHRLTITPLLDVYGNIIEKVQAGFSHVQDEAPPMITAVEQQLSRTMGEDTYLNFLVRFSERVVQGSRVKVNGVTLSFDDNFSFADDRRSMKLSVRANRNTIGHNTANKLSMELVDAMDNKGISLFEFNADTQAPSVLTKQSKQINAKTLRLAFNEADVKDIQVSFWNITGPAYTLSPLRADGSHWAMDVTFDRDMPDVEMFFVKVTDMKGNVTEEGHKHVYFPLITESPRFSSVIYSEKNAISIAMNRAVGGSEPPELIDAEGNIVSSDDYSLQWTASKTVLNIFFKDDLKAPLGKINLRKITRKENEELMTELVEIDKLGFLPETYLSGSYQRVSSMKASLVVAATVDPATIKVFRYDYEDSQNMLKPFDCQISSEAYQFQGFNRILLSCPGTGLKALKIELSNPEDAIYQDIW